VQERAGVRRHIHSMTIRHRSAIVLFALALLLNIDAFGAAVQLGAPAAAFSIKDVRGNDTSYSPRDHRITVLVFISTRCPMSNAFNARINSLYTEFSDRGVRFFVVNSNADESLDEVRRHAERMEYDFPVYKDENNVIADLFGAVATPDSLVLDENGVLRYHGIIEDGANPQRTTKRALRSALEAVIDHREVPEPVMHGRGCAIRRVHPVTR
jgi:peroxiredoxin